jgi:hypothetical protein
LKKNIKKQKKRITNQFWGKKRKKTCKTKEKQKIKIKKHVGKARVLSPRL